MPQDNQSGPGLHHRLAPDRCDHHVNGDLLLDIAFAIDHHARASLIPDAEQGNCDPGRRTQQLRDRTALDFSVRRRLDGCRASAIGCGTRHDAKLRNNVKPREAFVQAESVVLSPPVFGTGRMSSAHAQGYVTQSLREPGGRVGMRARRAGRAWIRHDIQYRSHACDARSCAPGKTEQPVHQHSCRCIGDCRATCR